MSIKERQAQYVFVIFLRFMSSFFYQFHAAKIHKYFHLGKNILSILRKWVFLQKKA